MHELGSKQSQSQTHSAEDSFAGYGIQWVQ